VWAWSELYRKRRTSGFAQPLQFVVLLTHSHRRRSVNMMDPNEPIARLLGAQSGFATRFRVRDDPRLHVDGVGGIALPVDVCAAAAMWRGVTPHQ